MISDVFAFNGSCQSVLDAQNSEVTDGAWQCLRPPIATLGYFYTVRPGIWRFFCCFLLHFALENKMEAACFAVMVVAGHMLCCYKQTCFFPYFSNSGIHRRLTFFCSAARYLSVAFPIGMPDQQNCTLFVYDNRCRTHKRHARLLILPVRLPSIHFQLHPSHCFLFVLFDTDKQ